MDVEFTLRTRANNLTIANMEDLIVQENEESHYLWEFMQLVHEKMLLIYELRHDLSYEDELHLVWEWICN